MLVLGFLGSAASLSAQPYSNITSRFEIDAAQENTSLIRGSLDLLSTATWTATNRGPETVLGPLHVAVRSLDERVQVQDMQSGPGAGPYGTWYVDLSDQLGSNGSLPPGGTVTGAVVGIRKKDVPFLYELSLHGTLNQSPTADVGGPYSGQAGTPIQLDASSSQDPESQALTFQWNFGDGSSSTGAAPSHIYSPPGVYRARLTVTDAFAGADTSTVSVLVTSTQAFGIARSRALTGDGVPLDGVHVEETGPGGTQSYASGGAGFFSLGQGPGFYSWVFSHPEALTVYRSMMLSSNQLVVLPHPWMTLRPMQPTGSFSPLSDTSVEGKAGDSLSFSAGAFSQITDVRLTSIHAQSLPVKGPPGWSPLGGIWLELDQAPSQPGDLKLLLSDVVTGTDRLALTQFDEVNLEWDVLSLPVGAATNAITVPIQDSGVYVLWVADEDLGAPANPVIGSPLPPSTLSLPGLAGVTADSRANPASRPASTNAADVTTTGIADFFFTNTVPSGVGFPVAIEEEYTLLSGQQQILPGYDSFICAYRRPGGGPTNLQARFPLRPRQLLDGSVLDVADIHVSIRGGELDGAVLTEEGGVLQSGELSITFPASSLPGPSAVQVETTDVPTGFSNAVPVISFRLDVPPLNGEPVLGGLDLTPGDLFVLARQIQIGSESGWKPVERLRADGGGGLVSLEPAVEPQLPGLMQGGQYTLFRVGETQILVAGTTRDLGGSPVPGTRVEIPGQPWLDRSDSNGVYRLLAPVGTHDLEARLLEEGLEADDTVTITDSTSPLSRDLTLLGVGPRIIATNPSDLEEDVRVVTSVRVWFSKPVASASFLPGDLFLTGPSGTVAGVSSLSLDRQSATFLADNPLMPDTTYTATVSVAVSDDVGQPIAGDRNFVFTTAPEIPRSPAGLTIYEPGATNCPCIGTVPGYNSAFEQVVCVEGGPGTADPDTALILVNESSGETATVESNPDGSFLNFIPAAEDDFIHVTFVNQNGSRIRIPATRQLFDDGRVGLYRAGGILEAESDGSPVQVFIEPGAVERRMVFDVDEVDRDELLDLLDGTEPSGGKMLGGAAYAEELDELREAADIRIPIDPADVDLAPGEDIEDAFFSLAVPLKRDGKVFFQQIDRMDFVSDGSGGGFLETRSPPFIGLLARRLNALERSGYSFQSVRPRVSSSETDATRPRSSLTLVALWQIGIAGPGDREAVIAGQVVAKPIDGDASTERPVAGAVVVVRDGFLGPPAIGTLPAGQIFVLSERDGSFGMAMPDADPAYFLSATHPRFPGQIASSTAFDFVPEEETVINAKLPFALGVDDATAGSVAPPIITIGHSPPYPSEGTGTTAFAEVKLTVVDDDVIESITLESGDSVNALTGAEVVSNEVVITQISEQDTRGRQQRIYRVQSPKRARVTLTATAVDNGDNITSVDYPISFGGTLPVPPSTNTISRFFVQSAWPLNGSTNMPANTPVTLKFNAVPHPEWLEPENWESWLTLKDHEIVAVQAKPESREITIQYFGRTFDPLNLTVSLPLQSVDGTEFNQTGNTNTPAAFTYTMHTSAPVEAELPELYSGAGVQIRGAYAYAIEGSGGQGSLKVYSLLDPHAPVLEQTVDFDTQPTDLLIVDRYPLADDVKPTASSTLESQWTRSTGSFVCVFSGMPSPAEFAESKFLTAFRIAPSGTVHQTGPYAGGAEMSAAVSLNPASVITKSKWDPPFLGFLDFSSEGAGLNLLNFQEFYSGYTMPFELRDDLPIETIPGRDANRDGDFTDLGTTNRFSDFPPLPGRGEAPFGKEFSWAPLNPDELLLDFDFSSKYGLVAAITRDRTEGRPRFWTVLSRYPVDLTDAFVSFDVDERARRVLLLPAVTVDTPTGPALKDLALVSFAGLPETNEDFRVTGYLKVVDLTVPDRPVIAGVVRLPDGEPVANSMEMRRDGKVALTAGVHTYLIDPRRLLESTVSLDPRKPHPSIVSLIPQTGMGARKTVSEASGLYLNGFGQESLVQADPALEMVRFRREVFNPVHMVEKGAELWGVQEDPVVLDPLDYTFNGINDPPPLPDPLRHFYVKVHAPGSVGKTLPLALVASASNGRTFRCTVEECMPIAISEEKFGTKTVVTTVMQGMRIFLGMLRTAQDIKDLKDKVTEQTGKMSVPPANVDDALNNAEAMEKLTGLTTEFFQLILDFIELGKEMPDTFNARRMSDNFTHPDYNVYLAGPFTLSTEPVDVAQLTKLKIQQSSRVYLQASPSVWAGLSPVIADNELLGRYTSKLDYTFNLFNNLGVRTVSEAATEEIGNIFDEALSAAEGDPDAVDLAAVKVNFILAIAKYFEEIIDGSFKVDGMPGAHVRKPVSVNPRNPVIFIPGIMGTYLEAEGYDWPILGNAWIPGALFDRARSLELDENGGSRHDFTITPSDAIRVLPELFNRDKTIGWRFGESGTVGFEVPELDVVYRDIINHLQVHGYHEYDYRVSVYDSHFNPFKKDPLELASGMEAIRRLDGRPRLDFNPRPTLFVYPYDWREDNGISAAKLHDYVQLIRTIHPDAGRLDIVAHSMGGLVARRYIEDHPGEIDRLVTIGSPFLGAPKAFMATKTGDFDDLLFGLIVPSKNLRKLAAFLPGLHQLLPSRGMFDLGATPFRETGWDIDGDGIFYEDYSYTNYINSLRTNLLVEVLEELEEEDGYSGVSSNAHPAAANSEAFHERDSRHFGDWSSDDTGVKYHHIVGFQGQAGTIGRVEFSSYLLPELEIEEEFILSLVPVEYMDADNNGPDPNVAPAWGGDMPDGGRQMKLAEVAEFVRMGGDGTVPLVSAARGFGSEKSLNAPDAKLYPVVTTRMEDHAQAGHNSMLLQPYVMDIVTDVLDRKEIEVTDVSLAAPERGTEGTPITVSATASLPTGGSDPQYVFDFGDGVTRVLRPGENSVTHVYERDGVFTLSCGVRIDGGVHGYDSSTITISNAPPVVELHPLRFISSNETFNAEADQALLVQASVRDPGIQDRHTFRWFVDGEEQVHLKESSVIDVDTADRDSAIVRVEVEDEAGAVGVSEKLFLFVDNPFNVGGEIPRPQFVEVTDPYQRSVLIRAARHDRPFFEPEGLTVTTSEGYSELIAVFLEITGDYEAPEGEEDEEAAEKEAVVENGMKETAMKILYGILSDVSGRDLVSLSLFDTDVAGKKHATTTVSGQGDKTDILFQATLIEDGIPTRVERFEFGDEEIDTDFFYEFNWRTTNGLLKAPGWIIDDIVAPESVVTNAAARDQQGPFVTGIINPWSRNIYLFGQDNFTASSNLDYFVGYDTDFDGVFTGERFYELTNDIIAESAFPAIPLTIVARDDVNNVSAAIPFKVKPAKDERFTANPDDPEDKPSWQELADNEAYCAAVTNVKAIILQVLSSSLSNKFTRQFLLADEHIWLEEQGSGAALWRSDDPDLTCTNCAKSGFKPKAFAWSAFSDNDYHFFMPTRVEPFLDFNDEDARTNFLANAQLPDFFTGDWYHKPPVPVDLTFTNEVAASNAHAFVYTYPNSYTSIMGRASFAIRKGNTNDVLGEEGLDAILKNPLTPADAIALVVDRTLQTNDEWRKDVPEMTPFAARREHFMWGEWALDLPPEFSDDPLGDAALGRQMLALKIILESEVIYDVPGFPEVSTNAPSYDDVLVNLKKIGIPTLEGYEWGILQEFNALHGKPYVYVEPPRLNGEVALTNVASAHFFEKRQKKSLKKLGKSGIRGALAWMACSSNQATRAAILDIDRSTYQDEFGGFEEYILEIALEHAAEFKEYAQYLRDWYLLKTGDDAAMTRIIRAGKYESFAQKTFEFMHALQKRGLPEYEKGLRQLYEGSDNDKLEFDRRTNSYFLVTGFTPIDRVDGIYQMTRPDHVLKEEVGVSVFNLGRETSPFLDLRFTPNTPPGPQNVLLPSINAYSNRTVVGNAGKKEPFYFTRTLADRSRKTATIHLTPLSIALTTDTTFGNSIEFDHRVLTFPTSLVHTVDFDEVMSP